MIIGIQIGDTSGCAVWDNNSIIFASSEERYTQKKNDSGFPEKSIVKAISECKITPDKIEMIVLPSENISPIDFLTNRGGWSIEDYIEEEKKIWYPMLIKGDNVDCLEVFKNKAIRNDLYEKCIGATDQERVRLWNEWRIDRVSDIFKVSREKVKILNHEYCHAAYSMYGCECEDYNNAMCFVYDGYGDNSNASVYIYEDGRINQVAKYSNFNIGRVYRYVTLLLGMKPNEHEFKVMGLAPYATEYIYRKPLEIFRKAYSFENGKIIVDPDLKDNYFYFKEKFEGMRFDGIAGALQIWTEEMTKSLVDYWMSKYKKTICIISGGVALNIKANMEIGKIERVKDLYVVGSAGDESLCIGAIYKYLDDTRENGVNSNKLPNLYLGDRIERDEVKKEIEKLDSSSFIIIEKPTAELCAKKLSEGLILGRAVGKMEFGARALGNRSILADPRRQETINIINRKIKSRDFWMPFTPSIMYEEKERYLDNPKGFKFPYMSIACETTETGRQELQAAIHPADKTARPQLVTREMNEAYYELLFAFKQITGTGALLNTSLNIHGYPIARNAKDAIRVLENSDLDGMIFEDYLVLRK